MSHDRWTEQYEWEAKCFICGTNELMDRTTPMGRVCEDCYEEKIKSKPTKDPTLGPQLVKINADPGADPFKTMLGMSSDYFVCPKCNGPVEWDRVESTDPDDAAKMMFKSRPCRTCNLVQTEHLASESNRSYRDEDTAEVPIEDDL